MSSALPDPNKVFAAEPIPRFPYRGAVPLSALSECRLGRPLLAALWTQFSGVHALSVSIHAVDLALCDMEGCSARENKRKRRL